MRARLLTSNTVLVLMLAFTSPSGSIADGASEPQPAVSAVALTGWNFDWDDNIFFMPTKIILFKKGSNEEREISTGEFASERQSIAKSGTYRDYEVRTPDSYRYFRDDPSGKRNYFLEDVRAAIEENDRPVWMGPSWDAFVFALSRPDTAAEVTIITARGHSQQRIAEGLGYLQGKGYIRHLPPKENLYAVSHSSSGSAGDPSAIKAEVMKDILDEFQSIPVARDARPVVSRDGDGERRLHLWGFSDDDLENFETARDVLADQVGDGRWANVKITVFYTGVHDPAHQPHAAVLKRDGSTRIRLPEELDEGVLSTLCVAPSAQRRGDSGTRGTTSEFLWEASR